MSRVFLIHGWGGSPERDWFGWAETTLKEKGFDVYVPAMPETEHPKITTWLKKIEETVGEVQPDDVLIGHSIGCLAILRYLEKVKSSKNQGAHCRSQKYSGKSRYRRPRFESESQEGIRMA